MQQPKTIIPEEIEMFLDGYGWHYKETTSDSGMVVVSPYLLKKENKGILITFSVSGEFVMV